jgi:hypothetical protein
VDSGLNLPSPPRCLAPVAVPPLAKGDDAFEALGRSRAALASANGNLVCSRDWYRGVRKSYAAKK